jgi:hypothetical protein
MDVVSRFKLLTSDGAPAKRRADLSESSSVKLRRDLAAIFLIYPDGVRLPI